MRSEIKKQQEIMQIMFRSYLQVLLPCAQEKEIWLKLQDQVAHNHWKSCLYADGRHCNHIPKPTHGICQLASIRLAQEKELMGIPICTLPRWISACALATCCRPMLVKNAGSLFFCNWPALTELLLLLLIMAMCSHGVPTVDSMDCSVTL